MTPILESEARRTIAATLAPYVVELGISDLDSRVRDLTAQIPREGTACALVDAVVWSADEVTEAIKRGRVCDGEHVCNRLRSNFRKAVRGEVHRLLPDPYALPVRPRPTLGPPKRLWTRQDVKKAHARVNALLAGLPPPPDFYAPQPKKKPAEPHDPDSFSRDPERGDSEPAGWTLEEMLKAHAEVRDEAAVSESRGRKQG